MAGDTDRLISASDDGVLYMWDLTSERIVSKYVQEPLKEYVKEHFESNYITQYSYPTQIPLQAACCPTALATDKTGDTIFLAQTDDSVQLIDTREKEAPQGTKNFFK